jgi:hypothetical protein
VTGHGGGANDEPAFLAQNNASVSVVGGSLVAEGSSGNGTKPRAGIRLLDDSSLTLLNGLVEGDGAGTNAERAGILAEGNSQVTIVGGTVSADGSGDGNRYGIRALGNSQISMIGGTITSDGSGDGTRYGISGIGNSQISILGGAISTMPRPGFLGIELSATDSAGFTIFGTNFDFPYGAIVPTSGILTGKLKDGSSINWDFTRDAGATITLVPVPEPDAMILLFIGFVVIGCWYIFSRRGKICVS